MSLREDVDQRMERAIARVAGVVRGRVQLADGLPARVYAIATGERPAADIVRDIQSLAIAGFDVSLDPSAVSVVRLKSDEDMSAVTENGSGSLGEASAAAVAPAAPAEKGTPTHSRPAIEKVFVVRDGDSGWIRVTLRWPDGERTEGAARATERRPSRARGAADATLMALSARVGDKGLKLEIDGVVERSVAGRPSVLVHVFCEGHGKRLPLMGSAFVRDDVGSATVKALLNAVDRVI